MIMKYFSQMVIGLILLLSGSVWGVGASMKIVVTDHGVVGDGRTDVTIPLQKLATATFNSPYCRQENTNDRNRHMVHLVSYPEVIFPKGVYVISDMIVWPNNVRIQGQGQVIIRQTNPAADVFYIHWAKQVWIDGLTFEGGRKSIKFWTHNIDQVMLHVDRCVFRNSGQFAIENIIQNTSGKTRDARYEGQKFRGLYVKDKTTGQWHYLDEADAPYTHNSTLMVISQSRFENCNRVLHSNVDWGVMQDCSIQMTGDTAYAPISNHGILRIMDTTGYWTEGNGRVAWMDHHKGQLFLRCVDFSGNGPVVRNTAEIRPGAGGIHYALVAWNSRLGTSSTDTPVFDLQQVPNLLSVEKCEAISPSIRLFDLAETADRTLLPTKADSQRVAVVVAGNTGFSDAIPSSLLPACQQPVHVDMDSDLAAMDKLGWHDFVGDSMASEFVDVTDYGAVRNDRKDDWESFDKALAAVAMKPGSVLVVPAGFYEFSRPIQINGRVHIRSDGHAVIRAMDDEQPLFVVRDATDVRVTGLTMAGGAGGWQIHADATRAKVHFDHCEFHVTRGPAIACSEGDGLANASPASTLYVGYCLFSRPRTAIVSNTRTLLENSWISSHIVGEDGYDDYAFLVNRGWMICRNILGVPMIHDQTVDSRWIDNSGKLWCDFFRFGGEFGGVTNVNVQQTTSIPNVTWIEHSWLYALRNTHRRTRIDVHGIPSLVYLRGNTAVEDMGADPVPTITVHQEQPGSNDWFKAYGNTFNQTIRIIKDNP